MRSANAAKAAGGTKGWPHGRMRRWRVMSGSLRCRSRPVWWVTWLNPLSQTRDIQAQGNCRSFAPLRMTPLQGFEPVE